MKYSIPEDNMAKLTKKLNRIEAFCTMHDLPFSFKVEGEHFEEHVVEGKKVNVKFMDIEVEGKASFSGWTFMATLEHLGEGNVVKLAGNGEIPTHYFTAPSICEHCNTNRSRLNTYVVRNDETGELKQVGNTCLSHFLGGGDAEWYARFWQYVEELSDSEGICTSGRVVSYASRDEALATAYELIRIYGYAKRDAEGTSTASLTIDAMNDNLYKDIRAELDAKGFNPEAALNNDFIKAALAWVAEQTAESSYMHDLKLLAAQEFISWRNIGLLVSLLPVYYRELNKREAKAAAEAEAKANPSEWQGKIGERIELIDVTIKHVTSYETDYGVTNVYKMNVGGNVYVWKTGKYIETVDDSTFSLKATIKAHDEFRGVKQTVLTRGRITERKASN